jgi:ribose 5-phosphate isomerase B
MKVFIGSDHGGFLLKERIVKYVLKLGFEVVNYGCHSQDSCDYPDIAQEVCLGYNNDTDFEENKFGILVCGTGIGMSMVANKYSPNIRCALCNELSSARLTREHNNANFLSIGARVIAPELAEEIVFTFLNTQFSNQDRHKKRIDKMIVSNSNRDVFSSR